MTPDPICESDNAATIAFASGTELRLLKNFFGFATVLLLFDGDCGTVFVIPVSINDFGENCEYWRDGSWFGLNDANPENNNNRKSFNKKIMN